MIVHLFLNLNYNWVNGAEGNLLIIVSSISTVINVIDGKLSSNVYVLCLGVSNSIKISGQIKRLSQ